MDPNKDYSKNLFSNTPDLGALLNTVAQNYINDKIGSFSFVEDIGDNQTHPVKFGVDPITASGWNNFLNQEVFQVVNHKYTQEEVDDGFSLIVIYSNDGGLLKSDYSNISVEIPVDENQMPAVVNFNAPLLDKNEIVNIEFVNDGNLDNNIVHVTLTYNTGKDWVGLYLKGETPGTDNTFIWGYVDENNKAVLNTENPRFKDTFFNSIFIEGEYEFILLENDSYTVLDRFDYSITNPCNKFDDLGNPVSTMPTILSQEGNKINFTNDTNISTLTIFMIPNSVWVDPDILDGMSVKELMTTIASVDENLLEDFLAENFDGMTVSMYYQLLITVLLHHYKNKEFIIKTLRNFDCKSDMSTIILPCIGDDTVAAWGPLAEAFGFEFERTDFGSFKNEKYTCIITHIANGALDMENLSNLKIGFIDEQFELTNTVLENDPSLRLKFSTDGDVERLEGGNMQNNIYLTGFDNKITGTQFTLTRTSSVGKIDTELSNTNYPLISGTNMIMPGAEFNDTGTSSEITTSGLDAYSSFNDYNADTGSDKFNLVTFNCEWNYTGEFTLKIGTDNGNTDVDSFKGYIQYGIISDLEYLGKM